MQFNNNIIFLGKNIGFIQRELGLIKANMKIKITKTNENENKIENKIDKNVNNQNTNENDWNIFSFELTECVEIEEIFIKIKNILTEKIDNSSYSDDTFSFTIVYSLDDFSKEKKNIKCFFHKIVEKLTSFFYLPFFIFLVKNEKDKSEFYNFLEAKELESIKIDKRNISCFISPLNKDIKNKESIIEEIIQKIFKIFLYYFELGEDDFTINGKKIYKEPEKNLFPINILLLGKTQVGKSTFINTLLKEKKAKEGGEKSPVTQKHQSFHIDEIPLIINDIEGFTGEENINKVITTINGFQKNLGEKELNLVIYIIDYNSSTFFNENEYPIFRKLSEKLDSTQFLFICSKSKAENNDDILNQIKKSFFKMINKGISNKSEKNKILNGFTYLYYSIKKDISYDEIKEVKLDKKKFEEMDFFEKLELKFKNKSEVEKNKEMIDTIFKKDETLIFVNLMIDDEHKKLFGMNKVSEKIREAFKFIQYNNMIFINENIQVNENKINDLNSQINKLKNDIENEFNYLPLVDGAEIDISNYENNIKKTSC